MATVCFDLDDTLFREMDFVRSGYRATALFLCNQTGCGVDMAPRLYDVICANRPRGFEAAISMLEFQGYENVPTVDELIEVYRGHSPEISLYAGAEAALKELLRGGHRLVLITDGSTRHQRSKIHALGLERYFLPEDILISEETGGDKTTTVPWGLVDGLNDNRTERYPAPFYYIGDNLSKDFYEANLRGWTTIMKRDVDGGNVFAQQPSQWSATHRARVSIDSFTNLTKLIH